MKKQLIAVFFLAVLMVSMLLSACSQNIEELSKTSQTTTAESVDPNNLSEVQKRQLVSDDLPNISFDGADYRVLCQTERESEVWSEEANGDICNDAVYERNNEIMERFNVNIVANSVAEPHEKITSLVLSDTDEYDLAVFYSYRSYSPITSKVLHNWYDVDYVNLDKPWYNKLSNDGSTINDKLFGVSSDFMLTTMMYTYGIFFNQYIIEDYGFTADGFYQMVFDGEWTIDAFNEIVSVMYDDLNRNGKRDKGDQYGLAYACFNPADVWFTAFGLKYADIDENGNIDLTFMNEDMVSRYSYLYDMHWSNESVYLVNDLAQQYDEEEWFLNQETVFAPLRFYAAYTTLRNRDFDLGILPYPKWDTEQENYYTNSDDKFSFAGVPLTVSYEDLAFVGIIFEALNAETYKNVYPVYYDLALKNKYTDDPITAEIIDILMEGKCFDFVFQFAQTDLQSLPWMWRYTMGAKNPNITSEYAKVEVAIESGIEKIYSYYED